MGLKLIVTGVTGMVGEGMLFACLAHPDVQEVLMVNRRHYDFQHPKLKELLVPDFMQLGSFQSQLTGYDGCCFCAGISSIGMKEEKYTLITYDTTLSFARVLLSLNKNMVFNYVSGSHTDSSEKGRSMWARVKGKTENDLIKLGFRGEYNFRPGIMKTVKGQKHSKKLYSIIAGIAEVVAPKKIISLNELGIAMINAITKGYPKQVLEIEDIKTLAKA